MDNIINLPQNKAMTDLGEKNLISLLIRDISNLLNSKPSYPQHDGFENFIVYYGLQDLSYYSPYSKEDQKKVSDFIKNSLVKFEPRLQNISVIPIESDENYDVAFNFKIIATLQLLHESMSIMLVSKIDTDLKKISLKQSKTK